VAAATLASETAKLGALATIAWREGPAKRALATAGERRTWRADELRGLLRLNRDLFVRTVLSMGAIMLLTRTGAQQGAVTLAANAIIFELFLLSGLMLDGFGNAAQVLCGEALGAQDRRRFTRLVRALLAWGAAAALVITLVYAAAGSQLAASFSTAPEVVAAVRTYLVWLVLLPVAGVASFVLDGVFIGSSWTRAMLQTMAAALVGYVALLWLGRPLGNHGLWLAYVLFFLLRAVGQLTLLTGLVRRSFAPLPRPSR
jgi:MATE family multidrug resistance protein